MNISIVDARQIESSSNGQTERVEGRFPPNNRVELLLGVVGEVTNRVVLKLRTRRD